MEKKLKIKWKGRNENSVFFLFISFITKKCPMSKNHFDVIPMIEIHCYNGPQCKKGHRTTKKAMRKFSLKQKHAHQFSYNSAIHHTQKFWHKNQSSMRTRNVHTSLPIYYRYRRPTDTLCVSRRISFYWHTHTFCRIKKCVYRSLHYIPISP